MIKQVTTANLTYQARPALKTEGPSEGAQDTFLTAGDFNNPPMTFEPWLRGEGQEPRPAICPGPQPEPVICPQPTAGIEPWLSGEPTDNPNIGPNFANKMVGAFGEQALLSLDDDRIGRISGYFLEGWESAGFTGDIALGALGDKWEALPDGNSFQLKSGDTTQKLSFDMGSGLTKIESSYIDNRYESTLVQEFLTKDRQGTMRRELPPVGL